MAERVPVPTPPIVAPSAPTAPTAMPAASAAPAAAREIQIEDDRTGMLPVVVRRAFLDNLMYLQGKSLPTSTAHDRFFALAYTVRDRLFHRWIATQRAYYERDVKRVYYLSAEFLMGRSLGANLINLGLRDQAVAALREVGVDLDDLLEQEEDAGLGNGGLGRLAACFLDSLATLALPGVGYGLRYEFGIFHQDIRDGIQVERPDEWLRFGNPWEIARPEYAFEVKFGGRTERTSDGRVRWVGAAGVLGVPYDTPIAGHQNDTVNTMRLWRARATEEFDLDDFNAGDYVRAVEDKNATENISKVLYPTDHTLQGKELRLKQQYFFVSCSVQDIVRRYLYTHVGFAQFPDKVAIQLNDTHPSIAIPELMRLLVDDHLVPWDEAWSITTRVCGYTNHTILQEALEKWPVSLFERLLPRHLEIIYEINARFLADARAHLDSPSTNWDELARRLSIIEEGSVRQVRMAHLAVIGSHSVNGVAALHTQLLRENLFSDFDRLWPAKFNNKTNGITPRRWLLESNPRLAAAITDAIGPSWITNLDELSRLAPFAEDRSFRERVRQIKQDNKLSLARLIAHETSVIVDPTSLFDVQVKRIHEYKRQLLNILHVVDLYRRMAADPEHAAAIAGVPRTFVFSGKAAPGYAVAKLIIRLITSVARVINEDPRIAPFLRVVFLPNYRVSSAQVIIPAADLSEQISTAGFEASGTGNMKLSLNGALTIGTLDGANVEIREEVGADNFFLFGLTAAEVVARKAAGYRPGEIADSDPNLRATLALVADGAFSRGDRTVFRPLVDSLLSEDRYLVLADFAAYAACQARVASAYTDRDRWTGMAILNIAHMGKFSSDRTIAEYARAIWNVVPHAITLEPYVSR